jgi:hypothetical protein
MNRMNPLFLKAFLTPSKNHANHCQIMFDYKNQFEVKSQTATKKPTNDERTYLIWK